MDVRSDEKWTNGNGLTYQRVRNRPLDPPTRITPPTGQTDDLEGPTCTQGGDLRCNELETCENGCKKNYKRRKRSAKANGIKDSPCPVETDSNKSCSVDYSNAKAATESCDPSLTASAQCSTKGLTVHCNAFDRCDLWSTVTPNILCVRPPAHSLEEVENPSDHSAIKTDNLPSTSITNLTLPKRTPQPTRTPLLTKARMALPHTRVLQQTQASHIEWVHYTICFFFYILGMQTYTIPFY